MMKLKSLIIDLGSFSLPVIVEGSSVCVADSGGIYLPTLMLFLGRHGLHVASRTSGIVKHLESRKSQHVLLYFLEDVALRSVYFCDCLSTEVWSTNACEDAGVFCERRTAFSCLGVLFYRISQYDNKEDLR